MFDRRFVLIKKLFAFIFLLFLIGCVGGTNNSDAQVDLNESYHPYISTEPSTVYLPFVTKNYPLVEPWVSTFGVQINYIDEISLNYAQEANNEWMHGVVLLWSKYQPNSPDEFILDENVESQLRQLKEADQKVIITIIGTPKWAQKYSDSHCGPMGENYLDDFANFVNQVVARYSQPEFNVFHYEIWNEPEVHYSSSVYLFGCWGDDALPYFGGGYYAEMLKVVYPAIKAANSEAQLILGGLLLDCDPRFGYGDDKPCNSETLMNMSTFFEGILENDGGNYFDIVNFHAYNYYASTTSPIERESEIPNWTEKGGQVEGKVAFLQEVMSRYDVSKPIILTEAGLIYGNSDVFPPEYELDKAEYVVWLYVRNWAKGLMATTWYTLDKGGWRGTGLLDAQNNPNPAFYAYKTMTDTLFGANFVREVPTEPDVKVFEFEKNQRILVLFSMDGNQKSINLPTDGHSFEAIDLFGNVCDGTGDCHLESDHIIFDLPVFLRFSDQN